MSLSLAKSKRIRSGHKAHVRGVINDTNELAGTYNHENPEHRSQAKHYKSTLTKKMELIATLNETVLAQVEEENIEAEIADSSKFMDKMEKYSRMPHAWKLKMLLRRRRKQICLSKTSKSMIQDMEVVAAQR